MKLFQLDQEFIEDVNNYKKIDGVFALALFGINCLIYAASAWAVKNSLCIKEHITLVGCVINLLMTVITILTVKVRLEKISSIGLFKGNWKKSVLIGGVLAGVIFFNNCLSHVIGGAKIIPIDEIAVLIIYYFFVALCEEILFRGYIGTRLYGLIKNPFLCMCVTGILFILMHFPYRMIAYGMSVRDLTLGSIPWIINLFATHMVFSWIYQKTNSLYGTIIPHWISNLAYALVIR